MNSHNEYCMEGGEVYGVPSDRLNCWQRLKRFTNRHIVSHKFKNVQIEMLYQRYFLRMNQNNAVHIVWLLFGLIILLTIIHLLFIIFIMSDDSENCLENTEEDSNRFLIDFEDPLFQNTSILELASNSSDSNITIINIMPTTNIQTNCSPKDVLYIFRNSSLQLFMFALCTILYTILLLCLYKQRINEIYLFYVSYAIIISLVAIDISFSITPHGK